MSIRWLIDAGADIAAIDRAGSPPLHYATFEQHFEDDTVALLMERGAQPDIYIWTALGDLEQVKRLIDQQPTLPAARNNMVGRSPLHIAAQLGHTDLLRHLIERSAPIDVADDRLGMTPLQLALNYGNTDAARLLVTQGTDLNHVNRFGQTALYQAAWRQDPNLVKLMLDRGADPNVRTTNQETPLHALASVVNREDAAETARILLAHGADPTLADNRGRRPIDIISSTKGKHAQALKQLLTPVGSNPPAPR